MNDQSKPSNPVTSTDTTSAISSRGSASGRSRCATPAGEADLFGQPAVPVPPSAARAKKSPAPNVLEPVLSRMLDELAISYAELAGTHGLPTLGTYGQKSGDSPPSAVLQRSLGSKYQALTDGCGSRLFVHQWKCWDMPLGGGIFAQRALAPRTSDSASTSSRHKAGWPSPNASDGLGGKGPRSGVSMTGRMPDGSKATMGLSAAVKLALAPWATPASHDAKGTDYNRYSSDGIQDGRTAALQDQVQMVLAPWATPSARDWKDTPGMATTGTNPDGSERMRLDQLPRQAQLTELSGWPTPVVQNAKHGAATDFERNRSGHATDQLHVVAALTDLAGWPTPPAQEFEGDLGTLMARRQRMAEAQGNNGFGLTLGNAAQLVSSPDSGQTPNGSGASTAKRGQLNPGHSRWLMGLLPVWDDCAVTVMRSASRKRGRS